MSAIPPTHPPGMPLQDDRHFIGILPLIGYQSEDDSVRLPPPYAVSMHAAGKERAVDNQHEALYAPQPSSSVKWDTLITACEEAKVKLKASLIDLDHNWFKAHLLQAEKAVVQQQLEAGLAQVQVVHAAAQTLCQKDTPAHLSALEAALKGLEAVKPAVSTAQSSTTTLIQSERINRWMQVIKNYLGPIALTGWGLIVQSGILSPDMTKRIPLVGGIIGLCLKIKENIDTCIEQAKTEDQAGLIQISNSLVEIFMEVDRIGKAIQGMIAAHEAQKQQAASLQYIRDLHKDLIDSRKNHDSDKQNIDSYKQNFDSNIKKLEQLNSTTDQLHSTTDQLNSTTDQLNSTTDQLHSTTDQLNSTTDKLHSTTDQLNSTTDKLHSTTDQLNSITDQLNLKTDQLNSTMKQLSQLLNSDLLNKLVKHDSDISELQKGQKIILENLDFLKN